MVEEFSLLEIVKNAYTTTKEDQASQDKTNMAKHVMTTVMTSVMMLQSVAMLSTFVENKYSSNSNIRTYLHTNILTYLHAYILTYLHTYILT